VRAPAAASAYTKTPFLEQNEQALVLLDLARQRTAAAHNVQRGVDDGDQRITVIGLGEIVVGAQPQPSAT
jgi:hypothetical protein